MHIPTRVEKDIKYQPPFEMKIPLKGLYNTSNPPKRVAGSRLIYRQLLTKGEENWVVSSGFRKYYTILSKKVNRMTQARSDERAIFWNSVSILHTFVDTDEKVWYHNSAIGDSQAIAPYISF